MHGIEGVSAVLNVEANAIHDGIGPRHRCGDLSFILHIDSNRHQRDSIRLED